jgi:hypothetical protein
MLLVDNAAYIDGAGGWWSNLKKSVVEDGYIWVNSTPTDKNSWFYQWYVNAKPRNKIKVSWNKHTDHDKKWFDNQKLLYFGLKNYNQKVKNELEAEFV